MRAKVHVTLKPGVLDPQGKAIGQALHALGFAAVGEVRQGKYFEIELADEEPTSARRHVEAMCDKLLANAVIENYTIEITA